MPVYFKNTSHSIMIGKDPIEKMGGEEKVTFSMYGENIPVAPENFKGFESAIPGTYTIDIEKNGNYEVILVGAGGGGFGCTDRRSAGGGSGAIIHGVYYLKKGTYTAIVGAGGSSTHVSKGGTFNAGSGGNTTLSLGSILLSANGGSGGRQYYSNGGNSMYGGNGGTFKQNITPVKLIKTSSGNTGNKSMSNSVSYGGSSVYGSPNYGEGGRGSRVASSGTKPGVDGYFKIIKYTE